MADGSESPSVPGQNPAVSEPLETAETASKSPKTDAAIAYAVKNRLPCSCEVCDSLGCHTDEEEDGLSCSDCGSDCCCSCSTCSECEALRPPPVEPPKKKRGRKPKRDPSEPPRKRGRPPKVKDPEKEREREEKARLRRKEQREKAKAERGDKKRREGAQKAAVQSDEGVEVLNEEEEDARYLAGLSEEERLQVLQQRVERDKQESDALMQVMGIAPGKHWCRFCGARVARSWSVGPWGRYNRFTLCLTHHLQRILGMIESLPTEEPLTPIDPTRNTELQHLRTLKARLDALPFEQREELKRQIHAVQEPAPSPVKERKTPAPKRKRVSFPQSEERQQKRARMDIPVQRRLVGVAEGEGEEGEGYGVRGGWPPEQEEEEGEEQYPEDDYLDEEDEDMDDMQGEEEEDEEDEEPLDEDVASD